jgi:hypothetical protein
MAAKNWIKKAIKKPGSSSAAAKHEGKTTAEYAEEKDDAPGVLGKKARLAETLMKLRKK